MTLPTIVSVSSADSPTIQSILLSVPGIFSMSDDCPSPTFSILGGLFSFAVFLSHIIIISVALCM